MRYREETATAMRYEKKRADSKKQRMAETVAYPDPRKTPKGSSKANSSSIRIIPIPAASRHKPQMSATASAAVLRRVQRTSSFSGAQRGGGSSLTRGSAKQLVGHNNSSLKRFKKF